MAKGDILKRISAPSTSPDGLAWDGSSLWVVDAGDVYEVDPANGTVKSSFTPPGPQPTGLTWDGSNLWVADKLDDTIYEVSKTGALISSFFSPGGAPSGLAWDGTHLWHADFATDLIYKLKTDGSAVSSFSAPGGTPKGVAFDSEQIWVADTVADSISRIDTSDGSVTETIDISGAGFDNAGSGLTWEDGALWVSDEGTDELIKIDSGVSFGPKTNEEKFNASYADASAALPKITALIRPADVQRSIDSDVSNLKDGPNFYTVECIFDLGELSNLNPYNSTTEKPRVFFVKDDQPGLRQGKNLLLKGYQLRSADPSVPVTCTFWGY